MTGLISGESKESLSLITILHIHCTSTCNVILLHSTICSVVDLTSDLV